MRETRLQYSLSIVTIHNCHITPLFTIFKKVLEAVSTLCIFTFYTHLYQKCTWLVITRCKRLLRRKSNEKRIVNSETNYRPRAKCANFFLLITAIFYDWFQQCLLVPKLNNFFVSRNKSFLNKKPTLLLV